MTEPTPNKVVSLDEYGRMRNGMTPASATDLMRECRRRVTERLGRFVTATLDKVDDALFACAEKAESNTKQTHYFDAMREVRLKRATVEERFHERFAEGFTRGIPRQAEQPDTGLNLGGINLNWDDDGDTGLGLMDEEQLEEGLAVTNMTTKLRSNCTTMLYALDQRIGVLLNDPELTRWENPVGPEAICKAIQSACEVIETGIEIRLIILKLFDQFLVAEARTLYQDLNKFLVDNGVLPEIRARVRKNPNAPAVPGVPGGMPGATAAPMAPEYATTGYTGMGYTGYVPQGVISQHPAAGPAVVNTLTLLQRGDSSVLDGAMADCDGDWISVEGGYGTVNILNGLRQAGIARDLGKSGDMTIDIVAMLFDYILADRNIHDTMRAQIGRLQIPVLKVALLDREFFARKSHPARRLLNGLASVALGWTDAQGTEDPVYRKVSTTVQRILDDFEDDIGLFDALARDLDAFLAEEIERARQRAERSAKIAESREHIEVARTTALDQVQQTVTPGNTLQLVQDFVSGHWKNLLFVTCAQHGKDSSEWKSAVQTMNDLIWSVKPKRTVEDRKRLAGLQNDLLQRLRMGMAQLSIPAEEQKAFLSQLVRAHGRTAVATDEPAASGTGAVKEDPGFGGKAVEAMLATRQMSVEEINRDATAEVDTGDIPEEYLERARQLREGQWLELTAADGSRQRAKLSWISPITGSYLFTDRQGLKAADMKLEVLAALLRDGRAHMLNDAPLLDRAVSTVLKDYARQGRPAD